MYIILEGIDGVGKSTQTQLLKEWLQKKGYNTIDVVEPTNSEIGHLIREILLKPESTSENTQKMLALLFAADRLTLIEKIKKAEIDDEIIISDRSYYSSIAYQNTDSISSEWIHLINKYAPKPDLTILLDLDASIAIERCDNEDCFENIQFLKNTREKYLNLLKTEENMVKIDATPNLEIVQNKIQKEIEKILK